MCRNHALLPILLIAFSFSMGDDHPAVAQETPKRPNRIVDLDKAFEWYDSLGYSDLSGHPLVIVMRIRSSMWRREFLKIDSEYGLLLAANENQATLLSFDLSQQALDLSNQELSMVLVVGSDTNTWEYFIEGQLKQLRDARRNDRWLHLQMHKPLSVWFVMARACDAAGHNELAKELLAEVVNTTYWGVGRSIPAKEVIADVADEFSDREVRHAIAAFDNPNLDRRQLLDNFRQIVRRFPKSHQGKFCRQQATVLEEMIREDREHAARKLPPWEMMSTQDRVRELIFRLRDQREWTFPKATGSVTDQPVLTRPTDLAPSLELVAIGRPALEQLIDSIDDDRPTRCFVSDSDVFRRYVLPPKVMRIKDFCHAIIDEIQPTGRRFDVESNPELAKRAMKAWYLGKDWEKKSGDQP